MNENDQGIDKAQEDQSKFSKFTKIEDDNNQPVIEETPIQPTKASESKPILPDTPENKPLSLKVSTPPNLVRKSPFRIITSLIIVIAIAAVGYFGYQFIAPNSEPELNPSPVSTPIPSPDPFEGYNTHVSSSYTIRYPSDISASISPGNILILTKYGPTQLDQTEFFDGISLTIQETDLENKSLLEYVENDITEVLAQDGAKITSSVEEVTYGANSGYKFTAENLFKFTKIFLQKDVNSLTLEITNSSIDPGNVGFQQTVDLILNSITITSQAPTPSNSYICPESEYIDCMPTSDPLGVDDRCSEEYLNWAAENCDGFKGAAY